MMNKIKENKKAIKIALITAICILVSFYIIYKLSSSIFLVITGTIILLIGSLVKDPEKLENKEELNKLTQLTIFSDEVLEPAIIDKPKEEVVKAVKKTRKKSNNVIDLENTNPYKFDEIDKQIKKSKKVKA